MKIVILAEAEVDDRDNRFCNEDCKFETETASCDKCSAYDILLKFDVESYRWWRCAKCMALQIGKPI
jgi:hypothetical protein